jgi:hypothetical protein
VSVNQSGGSAADGAKKGLDVGCTVSRVEDADRDSGCAVGRTPGCDLDDQRAGPEHTVSRPCRPSVATFALVPDLDMAGAPSAASPALRAILRP